MRLSSATFFPATAVEATCPDCGAARTLAVPRPLARQAATRPCDSCQAGREAAALAADEKQRAEDRAAKAAARLAGIHQLLREAGANPWEHGTASLDTYDTAESGHKPLDAVRAFLIETRAADTWTPVRGLYLCGDTGTGKTHLAVAALRDLLLDPAWNPADVVFDHAVSLIAAIQDTYSTGRSTEALLRRRVDARVWILDDLGSERASEDVVQRLTLIFTERAMRPTLVTSNDAPGELERRHAELKRVQSRLGPAYFRTVAVKGRDRRFDRRA